MDSAGLTNVTVYQAFFGPTYSDDCKINFFCNEATLGQFLVRSSCMKDLNKSNCERWTGYSFTPNCETWNLINWLIYSMNSHKQPTSWGSVGFNAINSKGFRWTTSMIMKAYKVPTWRKVSKTTWTGNQVEQDSTSRNSRPTPLLPGNREFQI